MSGLLCDELCSIGLPREIWVIISTDNPTTYYKLLQVAKVFKLDTNMMKAKFIKKFTTVNGDIHYRLPNGWHHSCNGHCSVATIPAITHGNGTQCWYIDGKLHRDGDLPTVIYINGTQHWYADGKLHRGGNKPAVLCSGGYRAWYINGVMYWPYDRSQCKKIEY